MITIRQIIEVASSVFNVSYANIIGNSRIEEHIIARHCVKAFASNIGYAPTQISAVMGGDRTTVYNSKKIVFTYGQLKLQYRQLEEAVMRYIPADNEVYSDDGIKRVTLEAYDERFLLHVSDFQAYIRTLSVDYSSLTLSTVNPERQNLTNCPLP